jgi:hypothetical protein
LGAFNAAFFGGTPMSMVWGCSHNTTSFPQRGHDGIDYEHCLECGHTIISKVQFGGSTASSNSLAGSQSRNWTVVCGIIAQYALIIGALAFAVLVGDPRR